MNQVTIKSPAKINFGLNIVEKRKDNFHNLETVFYPLSLCDEIIFSKSDKFEFSTNNEVLNKEHDNLIIKAVQLLSEHFQQDFNVKIELLKNIPLGAGLGGGSSNAAAALTAIPKLFNLKIKPGLLQDFALRLGSDVPFFLNPVPTFASSRGEVLSPVNFKIPFPLLIINPGIHISTRWAFENIVPAKPEHSLRELILTEPDFGMLQKYVVNDFETVLFQKFPEIGELKSDLYFKGALFALMSGSGSSVYAIFPDLEKAARVEKIYRQKYFTYIDYK
jgi:4-diphosphocytidyl-2-C-methyl-D-erythritol kinase